MLAKEMAEPAFRFGAESGESGKNAEGQKEKWEGFRQFRHDCPPAVEGVGSRISFVGTIAFSTE
jgi:hypothetical protein